MFSKMLGNVGRAFLCFLDGEDSWLLFRSFSGQNIQQDETKFETAPSFPRGRSLPNHLRLMMIIILFIDNNNNNNNRSSK